ncbi:hypothetical protein scyTo_0018360 [Scyliorhinus torazame]|uniref:Uncharacterized protein n=1 Tax=Scyliorhinus torazame TaxID=75743 RepID=A0A401PU18_SCYTO|nr:hypothetical protein [Scyliorhinus torazame]
MCNVANAAHVGHNQLADTQGAIHHFNKNPGESEANVILYTRVGRGGELPQLPRLFPFSDRLVSLRADDGLISIC